MGFLRWLRGDAPQASMASGGGLQMDGPKVRRPDRDRGFQLDFASAGSLEAPEDLLVQLAGGMSGAPISRRDALKVPAVLRARNVIASIPATLPRNVHRADRTIDDRNTVVNDPNPRLEDTVHYSLTFEDLLFHGLSYWRVTRFLERFPVEAHHVDYRAVSQHAILGMPSEAISEDHQFGPRDPIFIDGLPVPDREVIRFTSPNPPLLVHAARAIRTVLLLQEAANRMASNPMPVGWFTDREDADPLEDEEITEALNAWEAARRQRVWGYVPQSLELNMANQPNPREMQLAEIMNNAVLDIARATGLDPEEVGVSVSTRTYQNAEQRRLDLIDFTLMAYLSAVEDRLSKDDVTAHGLTVRHDVDAFARSDFKSRMEAYKTGREAHAITDDEIRRREHRPDLTPAEKRDLPGGGAPVAQPPAAVPEPEEPAMSNGHNVTTLKFAEPTLFDGDSMTVTFDDPDAAAEFRVDRERRTISGMAIPWGPVARNGFAKWRFVRGSLAWSEISRIKMNMNHNRDNAIGVATSIESTDQGLPVKFKVARGAEGDRALTLAEDGVFDGLSVEVDEIEWEVDPNDRDVRLVTRAALRGVALTATPAFDDARVTSVAATRGKGAHVGTEEKKTPEAGGATTLETGNEGMDKFTAELENRFSKLADKLGESAEKQQEAIAGVIATAFESAFQRLESADSQSSGAAAAARWQVVKEPPVYRFNGGGNGDSLVKDAWAYHIDRDHDARDRLRKFQQQQQDIVKFATVTTGTASDVIPPGYRPDLYVTELTQGRPITNLVSRGSISDATPFTVPRFVSATGATGDHTEGTNPTDGTLDLDTVTVTPGAVSGLFKLTREIIDASNPAIDSIALAAMRESWNQQTEQKLYAELNVDANVAVSTDYSLGTGTDKEAIDTSRDLLARYPFTRFAAPSGAVIGQKVTRAFANAEDTTGRKLLPSVGAQNSAGVGNAVQQGWFVDGLPFVPAWAMTEAVGDELSLIINRQDVWVWESPLLTFRFEERSGPAHVELALFGYYATKVLRPAGIFSIRAIA